MEWYALAGRPNAASNARSAALWRTRADVFGRNRSGPGRSIFAQRFRYRRRHCNRIRNLGRLAWPASQLETKVENGSSPPACSPDTNGKDSGTDAAELARPKTLDRARSRSRDVSLRFVE